VSTFELKVSTGGNMLCYDVSQHKGKWHLKYKSSFYPDAPRKNIISSKYRLEEVLLEYNLELISFTDFWKQKDLSKATLNTFGE
jgi:hypothetical protein